MAVVALDGRCRKANRSLCAFLGYTEEELLTMRFQEFTHPDDLARDVQWIGQLLRGECASFQLEKRYIHKGGSVLWAVLSVSLAYRSSGEPECFVSQIQDITARKVSEENAARILREKEELIRQLQDSARAIRTLQEHLITVCAWTKRIRYNGQWMSAEDFLARHLGLSLSHGISDEALSGFFGSVKGDTVE